MTLRSLERGHLHGLLCTKLSDIGVSGAEDNHVAFLLALEDVDRDECRLAFPWQRRKEFKRPTTVMNCDRFL